MKMALQGDTLKIIDTDSVQFTVIKSWGKMKYSKKDQMLIGSADMELLDKLTSMVKLPPKVEARRLELHRVQDAVDQERTNPTPHPFVQYPVKLSLFAHQVRGANMALLTFGWIEPPEGGGANGNG